MKSWWMLAVVVTAVVMGRGFAIAEEGVKVEEKPVVIQASEARKYVGKKVIVEYKVQKAKYSEKRKLVYLDSEKDFHDEKNLGVTIDEAGQKDFKEKKKIESAADHFRDKKIRVTGVVVIEDERPYIKVTTAGEIEEVKE